MAAPAADALAVTSIPRKREKAWRRYFRTTREGKAFIFVTAGVGGTYQGAGSTCGSGGVSCPAPTGACCAADATCSVAAQFACTAYSGAWRGAGSACAA